MRLTFLGTGASTGVPIVSCRCPVCQSPDPRNKRLRTSALLEINDLNIQIDVGPDFRRQTLLYNPTQKIDAVLLTHEHNDHILGIDELRPYTFLHNQITPIYADQNTLETLNRIFYYYFDNSYSTQRYISTHKISSEKPFFIHGQKIIPIKVMHDKEILGFKIRNLTYITDAKHIEDAELEKTKGTKTLVINALRHKPHAKHLSLSEALQLIRLIKPDQAYLTHISHELGLHEEVEKSLPPYVRLAYDGLSIEC